MRKEIISTRESPQAIGPYSQAVRIHDLIFVSGQIPIIPGSGEILKGNIKEQTVQVMENMRNILEAGGSSLKNVLRTTIFLANLKDYPEVNEVYSLYFDDMPPARSTVQVSGLPMDARIEMDAIAFTNTL